MVSFPVADMGEVASCQRSLDFPFLGAHQSAAHGDPGHVDSVKRTEHPIVAVPEP